MADALEKTLIDNIKELFEQLDKKFEFINTVAVDVNRKPLYLKQHWFREFWAIPEEYQARVVELLQNAILVQNLNKQSE